MLHAFFMWNIQELLKQFLFSHNEYSYDLVMKSC